ncbi:hypothetical protein ACWEVD_27815 [Nocardia thailandica]|uniref:Uncharacterized protein n=1 Tax=Nocardia thailandica TaxID=257275 RepID=A0ABW6PX65_9NOCA|nr:hypothetical protein [Nocardia thailandica]
MSDRTVPLWNRDRLYVHAVRRAGGDVVIDGQDLRGGSEYEYALTVPAGQVPLIVAALGGEPGADVLDLLSAHGEDIVLRGEKTWLESIGVAPGFWCHYSD